MKCAILTGVLCLVTASTPAAAQQRFALIVSGASGGDEYVEQYAAWTGALVKTLTDRMKFDPTHVTVLSDTEQAPEAATAVNVRRAIGSVRARMTRDDLLLILLVGHGTSDGEAAKFNLVGPDMESTEWASLLQPLPGQVAVVNTTAGSFPFIERLSGPRRIVITATDSAAQRFDTLFPEYFIRALTDAASDLDKNARISIWEAFWGASDGVRRHYRQRGLLATERALLDDTGDGIGKDITDPGEDGSYASRTYLDDGPSNAASTDEVLLRLLQRRAMLMVEVDELAIRRRFLPADEYAREFERVMIELARVSQDIRRRAGS